MRAQDLRNCFATFPLPSLGHQTVQFVHVLTCWGTSPIRCQGCIGHGGSQEEPGPVHTQWWLRMRTRNGILMCLSVGKPLVPLRSKAPQHCGTSLGSAIDFLILKVERRGTKYIHLVLIRWEIHLLSFAEFSFCKTLAPVLLLMFKITL